MLIFVFLAFDIWTNLDKLDSVNVILNNIFGVWKKNDISIIVPILLLPFVSIFLLICGIA